MILGIIGNGFVGKATQLLKCSIVENILIYDILQDKCVPPSLKLEDMVNCDLIFIALPTPMRQDGSCHLDIIINCIDSLNCIIDKTKTSLVLRSTVPPGTCEKLNVNFMPEFLTERDWRNDFLNCENWIFGCNEIDFAFRNKILNLFASAYNEGVLKHNNIHFIGKREAEMIKYVKNCFLALKVSFFNEINEFSKRQGIDFETVRKLTVMDSRIGSSHSFVPGLDGHYGFGGTCFPKDISALLNEMDKNKMNSYILKSTMMRNNEVDRAEQDWKNNIGRSVI